MDKSTVFAFFGIISLGVGIFSGILFFRYLNKKELSKNVFSPLQIFTAGIFLAVLVMFLPVFYYDYDLFGERSWIRPLFIAFHNTIRVFILDGDFDTVADAIRGNSEWSRLPYSFYSAFLYILAPILTFGNVLSMFKNLIGEMRFKLYKKRSVYIMSELNASSVAMAKSIYEKAKSVKEKIIIVFTDVFEQNEEDDYELLLKVRELKAICMKKDIANLNISKNKGKVEIFLIGETESENVEQAILLTKIYKNQTNVSIYVYATSAGSGYVIDSIDKGDNTLDPGFENAIMADPRGLLYGNVLNNPKVDIDGGFYLRRIDCVESLALSTITDPECVEAVRKAAEREKIISVLLIGMGSYGKQFFKTALWFYQLAGYKLEINIFDADRDGEDSIKKKIEQECPELCTKNPCTEEGEASYDIRYFAGIDCFASDFDKCFDAPDSCERLIRTDIAFVMLGDDDRNIEAAVMLRKLFDRKKKLTNKDVKSAGRLEIPLIYAVVYDEQKASNLSGHGNSLKNYKGVSYNVNFIGDRNSQYSYDTISEKKRIEKMAFLYHIDWLRKIAQLRHAYETNDEFRADVDANRTADGEISWGDEYMFYKGSDGTLDFYGAVNVANIRDLAKQYVNYEYYRKSSIAKAVHKNSIAHLYTDAETHGDVCTCEICESKRKCEHMRWNAYMRTLGYVKGERNDRGKTHPDLCPWNELPFLERFKD